MTNLWIDEQHKLKTILDNSQVNLITLDGVPFDGTIEQFVTRRFSLDYENLCLIDSEEYKTRKKVEFFNKDGRVCYFSEEARVYGLRRVGLNLVKEILNKFGVNRILVNFLGSEIEVDSFEIKNSNLNLSFKAKIRKRPENFTLSNDSFVWSLNSLAFGIFAGGGVVQLRFFKDSQEVDFFQEFMQTRFINVESFAKVVNKKKGHQLKIKASSDPVLVSNFGIGPFDYFSADVLKNDLSMGPIQEVEMIFSHFLQCELTGRIYGVSEGNYFEIQVYKVTQEDFLEFESSNESAGLAIIQENLTGGAK